MVALGSGAVVKSACWCFYYKMCVVEWLNSCQTEVWPDTYLGIFSISLKNLKWRNQFWGLNFFDCICLSISLFLTKKKNALLFLHFKTFFCCATYGVTVRWLASLSALWVAQRKPCLWKGGRETQEHMELSTLSNLCAVLSASKDDFSRLSYCNWAILI